MIRVVVKTVSHHFTINVRSARFSMIILLQDQAGRAFTHYKSVSIAIERPASNGRVAATHRSNESKSSKRKRTQRRFGASGDDHVSPAVANIPITFTDCDIPTRATVRVRSADTAQAELNRNIAMGGTAENLECDSLVDRFRATVDEGDMLLFCIGYTAQSRPEADANSRLWISGRERETAIFQSKFRRTDSELRIPIQTL